MGGAAGIGFAADVPATDECVWERGRLLEESVCAVHVTATLSAGAVNSRPTTGTIRVKRLNPPEKDAVSANQPPLSPCNDEIRKMRVLVFDEIDDTQV